jgi:uncharacterized membrane protein (DUF106 family)
MSYPFGVEPVYSIAAISLATSLLSHLVRRMFTSRALERELKAEIKRLKQRCKEIERRSEEYLKLQMKLMNLSLRLMKLSLKPSIAILAIIGPLFWLLSQIYSEYSEIIKLPFSILGIKSLGWLGTFIIFSIAWSILIKIFEKMKR